MESPQKFATRDSAIKTLSVRPDLGHQYRTENQAAITGKNGGKEESAERERRDAFQAIRGADVECLSDITHGRRMPRRSTTDLLKL